MASLKLSLPLPPAITATSKASTAIATAITATSSKAAAAIAAAIAAAATAAFTWFSLFYYNGTTIEISIIQVVDGILCLFVIRHFNESKAF